MPEQRAMIEPYKCIDGVRMKVRGALQLERNLNDDYVKFIRFAQTLVDACCAGIVGMITNNAFIENITFPGMRNSLLRSFDYIQILDLHGSTKAGGETPDGEKDENVFDIQQGVGISLFARTVAPEPKRLHGELWGSRSQKEQILLRGDQRNWFQDFSPVPEAYLFIPKSENDHSEYAGWEPLDLIFRRFGTGVMTNRNGLTIAPTRAELSHKLRVFSDPSNADTIVAEQFGVKTNALWELKAARREIVKLEVGRFFRPIDFRPFDSQVIFYHESAVDNMRRAVMDAACREGNVTLVTSRQQFKSGFQHALVTRRTFDECFLSTASREKASGFSMLPDAVDIGLGGSESNIRAEFLPAISDGDARAIAEAKLAYIYAILHSQMYRERYAEQLKRGYARVPQPLSRSLIRVLSRLGSELIGLHLLESVVVSAAMTNYLGEPEPEVENVGYARGTVWLDKKQTRGFTSVPETVWNFHIGGYQVCEKWLKDRKGRKLSKDDIAHYQKIIVAIHETIRLMKEIDEVIEKHGGWPGAFVTTPAAETAEKSPPFV